MFDFLDIKTSLIIIHLLGVAFGAGGAFASDLIFFKSIKDHRIPTTELGFIELGGRLVWIGLTILILSGIALVLLDPAGYLTSSKLQVKLTIVGIIFLNGLVFHLSHIPRMRKFAGQHLLASKEFMAKSRLLVASGAVSVVSWTVVIALGAIKSIPYNYLTIFGVYVAIISVALLVVWFIVYPRIFPPYAPTKEMEEELQKEVGEK